MAVQVSYPGVYIEEFTPAPPIQGAATSVAALLGPAASGPIMQPTLVTSWDQFKQVFGSQPLHGFYLWYAVQGFFQNGGQLLYVVRISNAAAATLPLNDRAAAPAQVLDATALTPGAAGNSITVKVDETQALNNLAGFRHSAAISAQAGTLITFANADDASRFRPGDIVVVDGDTTHRATIQTISGKTVTLSQPLPNQGLPGAHLRLADLETAHGDRVIRFLVNAPDDPQYLAPGEVLVLTNTKHPPEPVVVESASQEFITLAGPPLITYRVTLRAPVANDYLVADPVLTATSRDFDLTVTLGAQVESYPFLSIDPVSPRYWALLVNGHSQLISLSSHVPPDKHIVPDVLPGNKPATNLASGTNENLPGLLPADYQAGLDKLVNYDVNIVAIPDRQDTTVQGYLLDHCQGVPPKMGTRFAIFDSQPRAPMTGPGSVADQIQPLASKNGFGALYYPWVLVPPAPPPPGSPPPAVAPPNLLVPPSGHVAGLYARTDNSRGVHKAPAGIDAQLQGTIGVEQLLGDTEQGLLNLTYGVNVIRVFRGGQPTVWGARTTAVVAGFTNWQYVNIRRLFLFLEASISAGIRFAVFEPNNQELWGKLKRSITAFLTRVWRDGALFGATAKDAFYVRIDDALNPPDQMALGILTIEIGVRPAYPAEFIVVRIGIWAGGSSITEV
jgi:phage tail sheath protein FI